MTLGRRFSKLLLAGSVLALAAGPALAQADRSGPPKPGPARALTLPEIETHALSNGLEVLLVGLHEVPVVEVVLVLPAGSTADSAGREGLAHMTAEMLDEGAGGRDALVLADAIDFLGARVEASSSWDATTVRLRVPVARLADALPLMADVALRPDFPEGELERLRKEALTGLLQARDQPRAIASHALAQAVFGSESRYGRSRTGSSESIAALTVDELRVFHAAHYVPGHATLVVVGDVTSDVLPLLEKALGAWTGPADAPAPAGVDPPRQLEERSIWLVDKPGAAQSSIRLGRVGPSREDPRYHAGEVMNTLLGGSFTSRLNDNLREQHGYTYGAGSALRRYRVGGLFLAAADVQTDKTAPAVTEFFKELERIRTPATEEEVERARSYAALRYAEEFETTAQVAGRIVEKVVYGFADSFFAEYVPKALAVDAGALQAAAKATVDPEEIAVVVVGDRETVEAPLRALKLGKLRVLSVDDVMGPAPTIE